MALGDWIFPSTSERIARWLDTRVAPRPWVSLVAITVAFVLGVGALVLFIMPSAKLSAPPAADLAKQLGELDHVRESLQHLATFIDAQSKRVQQEQQAIDSLLRQRDELAPIVSRESDVLNYVLALEEQHAKRTKWRDLLVGTGFGVFSSFLASVFFELLRRSRRPKRRH